MYRRSAVCTGESWLLKMLENANAISSGVMFDGGVIWVGRKDLRREFIEIGGGGPLGLGERIFAVSEESCLMECCGENEC